MGVFGYGCIGSNVLPFKIGEFALLVLNPRVEVVLGSFISCVLSLLLW